MTKTINMAGTTYDVTFPVSEKVTKVMVGGKEIPVSFNHPNVIRRFEEVYANDKS